MINLPSFHPFFVLKLEVRALLQNVCNGICWLVASKIFSGEGAPRHPCDSRAISARSRTMYFKLATPLSTGALESPPFAIMRSMGKVLCKIVYFLRIRPITLSTCIVTLAIFLVRSISTADS